jgi:hypothetical protein
VVYARIHLLFFWRSPSLVLGRGWGGPYECLDFISNLTAHFALGCDVVVVYDAFVATRQVADAMSEDEKVASVPLRRRLHGWGKRRR